MDTMPQARLTLVFPCLLGSASPVLSQHRAPRGIHDTRTLFRDDSGSRGFVHNVHAGVGM